MYSPVALKFYNASFHRLLAHYRLANIDPAGRYLALCERDNTVVLIDRDDSEFEHPIYPVGFNPLFDDISEKDVSDIVDLINGPVNIPCFWFLSADAFSSGCISILVEDDSVTLLAEHTLEEQLEDTLLM